MIFHVLVILKQIMVVSNLKLSYHDKDLMLHIRLLHAYMQTYTYIHTYLHTYIHILIACRHLFNRVPHSAAAAAQDQSVKPLPDVHAVCPEAWGYLGIFFGLGFRVWGLGFRVQGSGFRVLGLGFRVFLCNY